MGFSGAIEGKIEIIASRSNRGRPFQLLSELSNSYVLVEQVESCEIHAGVAENGDNLDGAAAAERESRQLEDSSEKGSADMPGYPSTISGVNVNELIDERNEATRKTGRTGIVQKQRIQGGIGKPGQIREADGLNRAMASSGTMPSSGAMPPSGAMRSSRAATREEPRHRVEQCHRAEQGSRVEPCHRAEQWHQA